MMNRVSQMKVLFRSAQSSVGTTMQTRISTPPMVGVPCFFRCDSGPSVRITWRACSPSSLRITQGPTMKESTSAVIMA